jgi:menaquinone-dependent protoporphyrinogen oxidase
MKVLIVYATKYGCSKKCVELLSKKIVGGVEVKNIIKDKIVDLNKFDKIIIGGPIYMATMNKEITGFCNENIEILKTKKIGLFVCSMFSGEKGNENMNKAFPEELRKVAVSMKIFGGEMDIEKMKFLDKLIAKMVKKMPLQPGEELNNGILMDSIDEFAEDINNC